MNQTNLRPMGWSLSLLYFGLPALALIIGFYVGMPWLERRGLTPYMAYMVSMGLPLLALLIAALIAYQLEGHLGLVRLAGPLPVPAHDRGRLALDGGRVRRRDGRLHPLLPPRTLAD